MESNKIIYSVFMDEDNLNIEIRKFLKKVGITSQREIEKFIRESVCGQNNLLLIIPCHRVIRSDGSLGGFSGFGGIKLKRKLLNLEKNV